MTFNWITVFGAAFIPLITGMIWYNPKVMGKAWMNSTGLDEEKLKGANMALIFGLTYLFGLFIAISMMGVTVHQMHFGSVFAGDPTANDPNSEIGKMIADFYSKYGTNFRTFKHGALHGGLTGFFFAMPVLAIQALFERKSFKYIAIHTSYWILTLLLMGGVVCAYL